MVKRVVVNAAEPKASDRKRKKMFRERALRAWVTRRARMKKNGLLDRKGNPTDVLLRRRRRTALKTWRTRRARYGETGISQAAP